MVLSDAQLAQFDRDGFLILRGFADQAMSEAILDVAKAHLKHKIEPYETETGYADQSKDDRTEVTDYRSKGVDAEEEVTVRRLRQVYDRDILFRRWMESEELRPILQQVLRDQVAITLAHHNSIMTKMPCKSTQTRWHQDRRYWRFSDDNLVSVWLALDDEFSQNGVLEFIPGSHMMEYDDDQFDDKEYFRDEYPKNAPLIAKQVSTNLSRGDVVLFHCNLLHRANANMTHQPKISFVYTVKGAQTRAIEGTRSASYPEIVLPIIAR